MRIGILTFHSVFNFGANLQVLSTIGYLRANGYEPIVINWSSKDTEIRYNQTTPSEQAAAHTEFIRNHLHCSELCRSDEEIHQIIDKYNIKKILIGSDAVLQHSTFLSRVTIRKRGIIIDKKPESSVLFPNAFWGSFMRELDDPPKIYYMSVSSQNSRYLQFRGRLRTKMRISLSVFDKITVRDSWTQRMVKYLTKGKVTPEITPDPVFAFNQNASMQLSKQDLVDKYNLPAKYVLFSFRNEYAVSFEWLENFQKMANKAGLMCIALTMPNGLLFEHPFSKVINTPVNPLDWYSLIKYSNGYIGENMHPIIVALHNSVPFFAFDSYGIMRLKYFVNVQSSKTYDILSIAGFTNNYINILSRGYKEPSYESVYNAIKYFDVAKCKEFSNNQVILYQRMMKGFL